MTAYVEESFIVAISFTIILAVLAYLIKADAENTYTRQLSRIRNYNCECQKCSNRQEYKE